MREGVTIVLNLETCGINAGGGKRKDDHRKFGSFREMWIRGFRASLNG